jgi:hypothetical protein
MPKQVREEEQILQELQSAVLGLNQKLGNPGVFNLIKDLLNQQLHTRYADNAKLQSAMGNKLGSVNDPESPAEDLPKSPKLR